MTGHLTPSMVVVIGATLLSAGLAAVLAYLGWQRRQKAGAVPFAALMGLNVVWTVAYAHELAASGLGGTHYWFTVRTVFQTFVPVVWVVFALEFAGLGKYVTRRTVGLLCVFPLLFVWFTVNNYRWGWLWGDPTLISTGAFTTLAVDFHGIYWIGVVYAYLLAGLGLLVLARLLVQAGDLYRRQVAILLVAALPPIAGHLFYLSGWSSVVPFLDLTAHGFALNGVLVFYAVFQYGLLDLEPIARNLVIDDMDDAIIVLDGEERVIDANASARRLFETSFETATDRDLRTLFPELADALAQDAEEVVVRRTFQNRYFEPRLTSLDDARGHSRGVLVVLRDISARRHRELALEALQTAGRDLMAAQTREEVCERAVNAAEAALGHHYAAVHLREDDRLEPKAWTPEVEEYYDPVPSYPVDGGLQGEAYEADRVVVYDDIRELDAFADSPLRATIVAPLGAWGVIGVAAPVPNAFDESDVHLLEILAANTRSALDRAEREQLLRDRERELARQNERLDEFASVVSHDLRNPIGVADGFLELAEDLADVEEVELARDALDRAEELIDDLLAVAQQGESVTATEPVSLEDAVEQAWDTVETGEVELETVDLACTVAADEGRLLQILENLFRNAVEHGGSTVTVGVTDVGAERLGFYVADDGPGISEALSGQVFDHGVTTTEDGTGFGLSIVASAVEAHGWAIELTESESGGARFEIGDVDRLTNTAVVED